MNDRDRITAVLDRAGVGPIESIEERTDHSGSTCRLHHVLTGDRRLVAKVADDRAIHERVARELHVLRGIGHRLEGVAPTLVAGEIDSATPSCIVVLEHVAGRSGDSLSGDGGSDVEEILDRMSIAWGIDPNSPEVIDLALPRWGRGSADERPHRRRADRFARRADILRERFPEMASIHDALLDEIPRCFETIARIPPDRPNRIIHGDLHLDNVVFSPAGPRILDWQTTSIGDPVDDVVRLAMESRRGLSVDSIVSLCARHPESHADPQTAARSVIMTYAGLVSGLAGRPLLPPGSRDHRFVARMLSSGGCGTPTRDALEVFRDTAPSC